MIVCKAEGDAIERAKSAKYDVIVQGCNCISNAYSGFAYQMSQAFGTDRFEMERSRGNPIDKLGNIDFKVVQLKEASDSRCLESIWVCNAYIRHHFEKPGPYGIGLDYDALRLCFRKINYQWADMDIIIPGLIGCGSGGGNPEIVESIINEEATSCRIHIFSKPKPAGLIKSQSQSKSLANEMFRDEWD
jgi:hypothetical protein